MTQVKSLQFPWASVSPSVKWDPVILRTVSELQVFSSRPNDMHQVLRRWAPLSLMRSQYVVRGTKPSFDGYIAHVKDLLQPR